MKLKREAWDQCVHSGVTALRQGVFGEEASCALRGERDMQGCREAFVLFSFKALSQNTTPGISFHSLHT